jgi:serine/threonine protein kinase/Tol biopolymer transport system component
MSLKPGVRLGPYEILAALGAGGMGEVYKATDTRLDRIVAIKVLNATLAADPQFRERFDREARTISQLTHPHICTLYDVGRHEDTAYLVLEFLEGETLADRLARPDQPPPGLRRSAVASAKAEGRALHESSGRALQESSRRGRSSDRPAMRIAEALRIAIQVADALATAHRAGIVHRDLKPGNVMLVRRGGPSGPPEAKLLDFGLAKQGRWAGGAGRPGGAGGLGRASDVGAGLQTGPDLTAAPTLTSPLTTQGSFVGTLLYMSPEQLQGAEADTRSDIFAFGAVLYEMLTGRKAFAGRSQVSVMAAILDQDPPPITMLQPATPAALDRIVRKCLEKDPEARWQNARDLQSELQWIAETVSAEVRGSGFEVPDSGARLPLRTRWTWMAATAVLVIAAAAGAWFASRSLLRSPAVQPMRFTIVPPAAQPLAVTFGDRQLAISYDGRRIVYVSGGTSPAAGQLMVRTIDRLEAEPLRGTAGARFPFISPDGNWIGFFQGQAELRKVPITGGPSITLCRINGTPRGASWGPDDTIVFATGDQSTGLLSVPAGGGSPKALTKPDVSLGEQDHVLPAFLPDGKGVLFTTTVPGAIENAQIAVLDLETGQARILIRGGSQPEYAETGHLVYAAAGTLRAVRFDLAKREVLGDPAPVAERVGMLNTGATQYGISRTGALVFIPGAFASIAGAGAVRSLVWVNRQGREEPINAPPRAYFALRLSPDGTRIALDTRDQENDIWVFDLARQTLTRLTSDPSNDVFPLWTPDGLRIVFSSPRGGSVPSLFWQLADGTGPAERLTTPTAAQFANSFSPDGTRLLLQDGGTVGDAESTSAFAVSVLPMDGKGKPAPLIQTTFTNRNADVSSDGRWVAYESNDSGQFQIYVQPFPNVSGGRWQISTAGGTKPRWARSGRELFYVDATGALMTAPVQITAAFSAATPAKLLEAKYFHGVQQGRSYDVSRDGQRFLMIKDVPATDADGQPTTQTQASMVVVLNWFEELKQRLPLK